MFDIIFSVVGLMVFSIPLAIIFLLIKTRESHSFIYKQQRIGIRKKPFWVYKIQTMVDGEITPIGRKIRETGIDEIPQFINVLKGDMSIVGPRAIRHEEIEVMNWNDKFHEKRWHVRPGITGYAQMYAKHQSKASFFLDCKYIDDANVFLDFVILCITFAINIFGKQKVIKLLFHRQLIE